MENMVSFAVTSELEHKEGSQSVGIKLCVFFNEVGSGCSGCGNGGK